MENSSNKNYDVTASGAYDSTYSVHFAEIHNSPGWSAKQGFAGGQWIQVDLFKIPVLMDW